MLWQRLKASRSLSMLLALLLAVGSLSQATSAATISYGTVSVPPGVMFLDVEESSGTDAVPLFGPPAGFTTGLDFDPAGFVATATGGAEDFTDGQLNFTVMAAAGVNSLNLLEFGDYSLLGVGTSVTQALAGVIIRAAVTEINGVAVSPIDLTPVNASVGFNLASNPGIVQPWSLGTTLNVAGQLASRGRGGRATKVEIVINNQLAALSELSSAAFIAKKEFRIGIETIPEPATAGLVGLACCGLGLVGARRRS